MSITDLEGKVIDEWISSNKAHEIDGLEMCIRDSKQIDHLNNNALVEKA